MNSSLQGKEESRQEIFFFRDMGKTLDQEFSKLWPVGQMQCDIFCKQSSIGKQLHSFIYVLSVF